MGIPRIRTCYFDRIGVSRAEDRVKAVWTIDVSGRSSHVRFEGATFDSPVVLACLADLISTWAFPSPTEDIDVAFPFIFRAEPPGSPAEPHNKALQTEGASRRR
jgi:hypothetical protein